MSEWTDAGIDGWIDESIEKLIFNYSELKSKMTINCIFVLHQSRQLQITVTVNYVQKNFIILKFNSVSNLCLCLEKLNPTLEI